MFGIVLILAGGVLVIVPWCEHRDVGVSRLGDIFGVAILLPLRICYRQ